MLRQMFATLRRASPAQNVRIMLLLLLLTPSYSISLMFLLLGVVGICDPEKVVCRVGFNFIPHQGANSGAVLFCLRG